MLFREELKYVQSQSDQLLRNMGFSADSTEMIVQTVGYIVLGLFAYLFYRVTVIVVKAVVVPIINRSKNRLDDLLIKNNFFKKLSFLVPALWIYYMVKIHFLPLQRLRIFLGD